MRALKTLVIVMGVMLVGGFIALIVAIAMRATQTRLPVTPIAAPAIELPAGARVETMAVGPDRVVIDIVMPDGNRQIRVLDLASGHTITVIPLHISR